MFNKRIYYISGFDPRGARFYHRLFREESKKSEAVSGASITTGRRKVVDAHITQWQVDSVWNGVDYQIDYRCMTWDDVMKQYWVNSLWILILKAIPMYLKHLRIRLFSTFKKAGRGPYISSIYPMLFCVAGLILTTLLGGVVCIVALYITHILLLSIVLSSISMLFFVKYLKQLGEKRNVWWILQTYLFISRWSEQPLPDLEAKLQAFATKIIQEQAESPVDEIMLVGHCVGSMLAVEVMANVLKLQHDSLKGRLTVVTMGQCIPYLSYAPSASHFRQALDVFANNQHYPWFDMGARADPLCFQQVNPAKAEGVAFMRDNVPCQLVVKPYEMFSASKYATLKEDKMRMHFQYLMAADIKTDFDYFEIVTGSPANIQRYNAPSI